MKKQISVVISGLIVTVLLIGSLFGSGCALSPVSSAAPSSETASAISSVQTTTTSSADGSGATSSAAETVSESTGSTVSAGTLVSTSTSTAAASTRLGIADTVDKIADSVVAINVTGVTYDYFNRAYPTEGSGSGVIISSDGYIITNNHVVTGGNSITVFLNNGKSYEATLIGKSSESDVALLKINATGLTPASIGVSSTLRVGDMAIAIGNPLGELQGTVTQGVISGLRREITTEDGATLSVLQTDAAVNPGNSGGGLFDSNGDLIGIVVAKSSSTEVEGLGFVLPIDDVMPVVEQLMTYGYVTGRAYIGCTMVDITSTLAARINNVKYLGVYVYEVETGSPAAEAGLQVADYVKTINGTTVSSTDQATALLANMSIGDKVTFVIWRNDNEMTLTVTVGENKN